MIEEDRPYGSAPFGLGRVPLFDPRSRNFAIRDVVTKKPRSYTWRVNAYLDQRREGACVGFSFAHELAAVPKAIKGVTDDLGLKIYKEAQKIDYWEGEDYSGTSVLAGAKICQSLGYFDEYRWAFGLDDLVLAVGSTGPAILGVNWYEGMFYPNSYGFIEATGSLAGGHAILCNSVDLKKQTFKLHNSWGRSWGKDGTCLVSWDTMKRLLDEQGEACIPMLRKTPKVEA